MGLRPNVSVQRRAPGRPAGLRRLLQSAPPAHRARWTLTRGRCQQRPWRSQLAASASGDGRRSDGVYPARARRVFGRPGGLYSAMVFALPTGALLFLGAGWVPANAAELLIGVLVGVVWSWVVTLTFAFPFALLWAVATAWRRPRAARRDSTWASGRLRAARPKAAWPVDDRLIVLHVRWGSPACQPLRSGPIRMRRRRGPQRRPRHR
jgi:hypothetical protein